MIISRKLWSKNVMQQMYNFLVFNSDHLQYHKMFIINSTLYFLYIIDDQNQIYVFLLLLLISYYYTNRSTI